MIRLQAIPTIHVNIINFQSILGPTSNSSDEEIDVMHGKIEELMSLTEEKPNVFISGDFNASIREQTSTSTHVGKYGYQNDRGSPYS